MAAGATYEPISTQTLSTNASTITFSSISNSYTDLILVINATTDTANALQMQFNGDTGSNYSNTSVVGNGTTATSARSTSQSVYYYGGWITGFGTTGGNAIIQIQSYAKTTTFKTAITRFNAVATETEAIVGMWRNTSAITSIVLSASGGAVYQTGSTFTLYGIAAA
jgi:hypothetical protein